MKNFGIKKKKKNWREEDSNFCGMYRAFWRRRVRRRRPASAGSRERETTGWTNPAGWKSTRRRRPSTVAGFGSLSADALQNNSLNFEI